MIFLKKKTVLILDISLYGVQILDMYVEPYKFNVGNKIVDLQSPSGGILEQDSVPFRNLLCIVFA